MWKRIAIVLALLFVAATADAATRTDLQTAATAVGNGKPMTVDDKGAAGLTVTGTFVGTVAFEGSADGGTTWGAVTCTNIVSLVSATTTTGEGQFQCPVAGLSHFRGRISAYTSGSITVVGTASNGSLGSVGAGGAGGSTPTLAGCWATESAPTYLEGVLNKLSCTLTSLLRVEIGSLLWGEDDVNELFRIGWGKVRQTTIVSGAVGDATGAAVEVMTGTKRFEATITGAGAVVQTIKLYGGQSSSMVAATSALLCTINLNGTSGAAGTNDGCTVTTPWSWILPVTSASSGTPTTSVIASY